MSYLYADILKTQVYYVMLKQIVVYEADICRRLYKIKHCDCWILTCNHMDIASIYWLKFIKQSGVRLTTDYRAMFNVIRTRSVVHQLISFQNRPINQSSIGVCLPTFEKYPNVIMLPKLSAEGRTIIDGCSTD